MDGKIRQVDEDKLKKLHEWFKKYVAGCYGTDKYVNANLKLKEEHTLRTCSEAVYISRQLGLGVRQQNAAEAVALLHDVGRFEQFLEYRTYNDRASVDHSRLGLEILRKNAVFAGLSPKERRLIEGPIAFHSAKELPANINGQCLLLSKIIRDADKLDIFHVCIESMRQYLADPENFHLEVEFPRTGRCSPEVVDDVLAGRRTDYGKVRTFDDHALLRLGWVYDVNFAATLKRMKDRGFLEETLGMLPESVDVGAIRAVIFSYVDSRIEKGD